MMIHEHSKRVFNTADRNEHQPKEVWLVIASATLLSLGLLMVASASAVISDKQFGYPFHYLLRQLIFAIAGIAAAITAARLPIKSWQRFSPLLLLFSLLLLIAVLIPGIGHVVNGSRRWISFGISRLQVSELAKLCFILYLANYISRYQQQIQNQWQGFLRPLVVLAIVGLLLLLEPDFGSLAVLSMTALFDVIPSRRALAAFFQFIILSYFTYVSTSYYFSLSLSTAEFFFKPMAQCFWFWLPADTVINRFWSRRHLWRWPGQQHAKTILSA